MAFVNVGKQRETPPGVHGGHGHGTGGSCDVNQMPRARDTSRIGLENLMAKVGEEFPLESPGCGSDA